MANNEPVFTAVGNDEPRSDLPFAEREAITAVVRNPKNGHYLGLRWKQVNWETWITGGVEEGQTPEEAARTEIKEETGYQDLRLVDELPRYHAKFFHHPKGVNRFAHFSSFLFEITDEKPKPPSEEELEKHEPVWLNKKQLREFNLPEGHRFLIDHILKQGL